MRSSARIENGNEKKQGNWREMTESKIEKLSEALAMCRRELAQVREQQEPLMEELSQLRVEARDAVAISNRLADALAKRLSADFWEEYEPTTALSFRRFIGSRWPWLKRRFGMLSGRAMAELDQIRLIEGSSLFQATWYLTHYPDVALAGINPATHYLRSGAGEGRDPGPDFNTRDYLVEHPEVEAGGMNPLAHFLQSQASGFAAR